MKGVLRNLIRKPNAVREVLDQIGDVRDPIRNDLFMTQLSQEFGIDETIIRREAAGRGHRRSRFDEPPPEFAGEAPSTPMQRRRRLTGPDFDEVFALLGMLTDQSLAKRFDES